MKAKFVLPLVAMSLPVVAGAYRSGGFRVRLEGSRLDKFSHFKAFLGTGGGMGGLLSFVLFTGVVGHAGSVLVGINSETSLVNS